MVSRIKLITIELSQPLPSLSDLGGYGAVWGLVQWQGQPIGRVWVPTEAGACTATQIAEQLFPEFTGALLQAMIGHKLRYQQRWDTPVDSQRESWNLAAVMNLPSLPTANVRQLIADRPTITVAYCLLNRQHLQTVWTALAQMEAAAEMPLAEILIIESLPLDNWVKDQIHQTYPHWRYLAVQERGLNAARNAAIAVASGSWIAFSDTRARPDAQWLSALQRSIQDHPDALVRTGLVLHGELEQPLQKRFEDCGYSLEGGFTAYVHRFSRTPRWTELGAVGSGANMAFARRLFERIGGFDPSLDQDLNQTVNPAGGDWEMLSRALLAGESIVYEPSALVRYAVPSQEPEIRQWLQEDTAGFYRYIGRSWQRYPNLRRQFGTLALWKLARLSLSWLRPGSSDRSWLTAALKGVPQGLRASKPSKKGEAKTVLFPAPPQGFMAVREVDLSQPLQPLRDLDAYQSVRLYLRHGNQPLGQLDLTTQGAPISVGQLIQAISTQLGMGVLAQLNQVDVDTVWQQANQQFIRHWTPLAAPSPPPGEQLTLPLNVPVSVIITTCDRPADLANCLQHLLGQKSDRQFEIIVADNRPGSGLTPPIVAQFPTVRYVAEPRPGGSYGRNAAFVASHGDIVVTVDDDVTVPPDWLEKLLAPMHRPEVMVVTGNVLPLELETKAQWMFETLKGGLGEGFKSFEVDGNWLASFDRSPPTWDLGVSANSAFRASIFAHPQIGMMDEVLGPGTPTVGGEENHLIYKVLRAGYTLVYEPSAYVWHRHRRDLKGLYKQIYGHMKGGTAYHLLLWLQEKDHRGRDQLFSGMPNYLRGYFWDRLRGRHQTPWRIMWSELTGYVAGFWGYWQSVQRLQQLGRSAPYVPVARRSAIQPDSQQQSLDSLQDRSDSAQETV